jgi:hypothetical protein
MNIDAVDLYAKMYAKAVELANKYPGKKSAKWADTVDKHIKYMVLIAGEPITDNPEGPEV